MSDAPFDCFRSLALDDNATGMDSMLDAGFDVNTVNVARQTVLMHCCANDRQRTARFLVARGADLNVSDHGGTTAMDFALRHASRDFRDWLAGAGARSCDSGDHAHRPAGERRT